jgi:hypothetical protein
LPGELIKMALAVETLDASSVPMVARQIIDACMG